MIKSYQYPTRYRLRRYSDQNDHFARLFQFSPDGILILQEDGFLHNANPAFIWMLGMDELEFKKSKTNVFDFIVEDDRDVFASCLEMVLRNNIPSTRMEANFTRADGTSFPTDVSFGLFNGKTTPIAQVIIHDISEYKATEEHNIKTLMELEMTYTATLNGWSKALELRGRETQGHSQRVTDKTVEIALRIGISMEKIIHVRHGALLHDIGKMAIPDAILFKPTALTTYERHVIEQHPTYAYNLLSPIKYLEPALTIPYSHHEKWDGTGYPQGLRNESIPLEARIFSVVDVWDSLISERPYRSPWPEDQAKEYIWENQGTIFDPDIVKVFMESI